MDITVVIVNYNTGHLLPEVMRCLRAATEKLQLQVIVVDNASSDDSRRVLREMGAAVHVIENSVNVGFGRANNQAMQHARGRYILLLNTDAFIAADTLQKTYGYLEAHPECGLVGARLVGRDGSLQPSCRYFPTPWNQFLVRAGLARFFPGARLVDDMAWDHASLRECDWVPGCYYLVRREVIEQVGLFDPRYFLYYEEVDHCRAVKAAGWKVVFYPYTTVVHIGGESAKSHGQISESGRQIPALQLESELLYFRKHHGLLGLWTLVALDHLATMMQTLRSLLKQVGSGEARARVGHLVTIWKSLRATSWATRPTR